MFARFHLGVIAFMTGLVLVATFIGDERSDVISDPKPTGERAPKGLAKFYSQPLKWTECGNSICTWVKVPLDYAKPGEATIRLRVKLRRATADKPRGRLFINPGGPGGSGVDFVNSFVGAASPAILEAYDIVGFDPRGVGLSTPLECLSDKKFDDYNRIDPTPDDFDEIDKLEKGFRSVGKACEKNSTALAEHVSTSEVSKDLDILRALVGEDKLDYYGASYGTQIGATYAQLFPDRVGAMILDGGVDTGLSKQRQGRGQAKGFEKALDAFLKDCSARDQCPLADDADDAEDSIVDLLAQIDEKPLKTPTKRTLTENAALYGIVYALYGKGTWPELTTALDRASFGDGTDLLKLSDQYFGRRANGTYRNNGSQVVNAIRCLDFPKASDPEDVAKSIQDYVDDSPVFGRAMAWTAAECDDWPLKSTSPQKAMKAERAGPIMVIGTTRDPATPYEWSKSLAKRLESGVLVTRVGDGHTGYAVGNSCVDRLVERLLLLGKLPKDDSRCEQ